MSVYLITHVLVDIFNNWIEYVYNQMDQLKFSIKAVLHQSLCKEDDRLRRGPYATVSAGLQAMTSPLSVSGCISSPCFLSYSACYQLNIAKKKQRINKINLLLAVKKRTNNRFPSLKEINILYQGKKPKYVPCIGYFSQTHQYRELTLNTSRVLGTENGVRNYRIGLVII